MIGAVLFDIDGTLIDSNDLHAAAWAETFGCFGRDMPIERIRGQIGKGGDNLIPSLLPDVSDGEQEEMETFRSDLFKRDYLPRVVPFPGVRALFERIAADGKKIVLASSASAEEVHFHLGVIGAGDLVTATTSADEVEHSKPCPDIFAAALAKVAPLGAEEVLVVGDSPFDAQAAKRLGVGVIGVRSGGFPDAALLDAGADQIFNDPQDLLARYEETLIGRG